MEWIQQHVVGVLVGLVGSGLVLSLVVKIIPVVTKKYVGKAFEDLWQINTGNPVRDKLVKNALLANMMLLEYVNPDRGQGSVRKQYLVDHFGSKISPVVEECMDSLDDTMKAKIKEWTGSKP